MNYGTIVTDKPITETKNGKVLGVNRNGIAIFRGIPYGDSCDGIRRFLPAEPAPAWEGVRDCRKNGPIAMQNGTSISGSSDFGAYFNGGKPEAFGCEDEIKSENCLVLNVLTPGLDEKKRPVVFYIHGGGYTTGSGTLVLGADAWCREEDIVLVGVNHRLAALGYLYLGEYDQRYAESGNAGILDLVLALKWVKENIASFGGDPSNVTLMGESGGGGKINCLIASKRAEGLFQKVIIESGSVPAGMTGCADAAKMTAAVLEQLQIKPEEWKKILSIPAMDVINATEKVSGGALGIGPIGDDIVIPYNAQREFKEVNPQIPMMVGATEEEMAAFAEQVQEEYTWETLRSELLSPVLALRALKNAVEASKRAKGEDKKESWGAASTQIAEEEIPKGPAFITEENVDAIIEKIRANDKKGVDPQHIYYQITSMSGFLAGGAFMQACARASQSTGPVYAYFFTYDAVHPRHPEYHYSWHTSDLPLQMRIVGDKEAEDISRKMAHMWAEFAQNGNPSTEELEWPAFELKERKTMVLDMQCHVESDPTAIYRAVLK